MMQVGMDADSMPICRVSAEQRQVLACSHDSVAKDAVLSGCDVSAPPNSARKHCATRLPTVALSAYIQPHWRPDMPVQ